MAIGLKQPLKWLEETGGLLIHYSWMMAIPLYAGFGFMESVGFLFVSQLFGGLLLGYVFLQSHNAMEVRKWVCGSDRICRSYLLGKGSVGLGL